MRSYYIYILSNFNRTVLYTGVTDNIVRRLCEHKIEFNDGFTKKYQTKYLLYYEGYSDIKAAIAREKQLKNWHREWKTNLIKSFNPEMKDLSGEIIKAAMLLA